MNTQPPAPTPAPGDDPVERLLREQSLQSAAIPDDGFTARVLHSLPPPIARRASPLISLRTSLILAGALTGLLLAWSKNSAAGAALALPSPQDFSAASELLITQSLHWLSDPSQLIALGTVAAIFGAFYLLDEHSQNSH